jgi:hypothetical protein
MLEKIYPVRDFLSSSTVKQEKVLIPILLPYVIVM